ncbi:unnamed protein product [Mesocestoides corti]|uniref:SMB domain-containing protein n=1 Tax=Mesocestoides corti TaxID=53468 RepID=A0A0R3U3F2_MESCO|nr:unnamed protein product [Mesocestoides corti]
MVDSRLLACFVVLLACSSLASALTHGSCRNPDGTAICCTGRTNCEGVTKKAHATYVYSNSGYRTANNRPATVPKATCFCDEYCVRTNDCCRDYREVCAKPKVNCEVSAWSSWSPCSQQCGKGNQTRVRTVTREAVNGGDQCPLLMESRACKGHLCSRRRVGRSEYNSYRYMELPAEVAHLLPVHGDIEEAIKQFDMRWDIRRKLYYGRLIQQNKTDTPDPEPYCVYYEIVKANDACKGIGLHRRGAWRFPSRSLQHYFDRNLDVDHPWLSSTLMRPGQQICAVCYPKYMRADLGNRCPGTGYPGIISRWRALNTYDCQGTFRMVSMPQRACTCRRQPTSFILT